MNFISDIWQDILDLVFFCFFCFVFSISLFTLTSQKTSKLHITSLLQGKTAPANIGIHSQWASNAENISISWHHHASDNDNILTVFYCGIIRIYKLIFHKLDCEGRFSWKKNAMVIRLFMEHTLLCYAVVILSQPIISQTLIHFKQCDNIRYYSVHNSLGHITILGDTWMFRYGNQLQVSMPLI